LLGCQLPFAAGRRGHGPIVLRFLPSGSGISCDGGEVCLLIYRSPRAVRWNLVENGLISELVTIHRLRTPPWRFHWAIAQGASKVARGLRWKAFPMRAHARISRVDDMRHFAASEVGSQSSPLSWPSPSLRAPGI
jgi:hypothetical protein